MEISPYYHKKKAPETEHKLMYNSSSETLEPVYFFIIDLMDSMGLVPEKLVDNFNSSPGSGHFSELGQKASLMQQNATKLLADVNTVLRSVLNLIYDLKDFRIRLQYYEDTRLKDKNKKDAAILALKQIWLDKVDVQKGNSGIKQMALSQAGFLTLIDAFLVVKDIKDVKNLDLNERVKRIITPRIAEFNAWIVQSEKELRKRYELEKNYLKSQVNSLKLYTRWAKPYLKAASQLETKDYGRDPTIVNVFNTLLLELTVLGKQELKLKDEALQGNLPREFINEKFANTIKRKYYAVTLVDFRFRGIPQKSGQHYVFGGRADVTFRGYVLNSDELAKLDQELDNSDLEDALNLVEGATEGSLKQLQEEIDYFLDEKDVLPSEEKKDDSNPFVALIGGYNKSENTKKTATGKNIPKEEIIVKKDSWIEEFHLRRIAGVAAAELAFKLFDIYKKAHQMPSYT